MWVENESWISLIFFKFDFQNYVNTDTDGSTDVKVE